jgi:signal transduction histidine kinase
LESDAAGSAWARDDLRGRRALAHECAAANCEILAQSQRVSALASELALAEERERRRISQGLHDDIGQTLAAAKLHLTALRKSGLSAASLATLAEVTGLVNSAIEASRSLTFELSCPVLYELGLAAALRSLGERLERTSGVLFHFQSDDRAPRALEDETGVILYRSARELMNNAVIHSGAGSIEVSIHSDERCTRLRIADDGNGFDAGAAVRGFSRTGGFGLFAVREQLNYIGGELEIRSSPGAGTQAVVSAPSVAAAESRS